MPAAQADTPWPLAETDVAVIGMAGRYPDVVDLADLWELVQSGRSALNRIDPQVLVARGVSEEVVRHPDYVPVAGVLSGVEMFAADHFGISHGEAALLDPQHRHFLELSWEAMVDAGHLGTSLTTGVFAGCGMTSYFARHLLPNEELLDELGLFHVRHAGNDKDFLATMVAYHLDLRGPAVAVQTACSTSLVAVHLAGQSLIGGECDLALAGGVSIQLPHGVGYLWREGEVLSRDGRCLPFDASASGTVITSGAGVVVLRRALDAWNDGDEILAVIRGSAVNNDGRRKAGYLAPSVDGHAAVVGEALQVAGIEASSVGLVEAHGTGTLIGDPIEFEALAMAFRASTGRVGFCRLNSIKGNIGHTDTAAGVAGLFAAIQAMRNQQLPPLANFSSPNPYLALENSPFVLSGRAEPWTPGRHGRVAGVSSLGIGGTNAHVIVSECLPRTRPPPAHRPLVLAYSASTTQSLGQTGNQLADTLERDRPALDDVVRTLDRRRDALPHRAAVVARDVDEAISELRRSESQVMLGAASAPGGVVFAFPGGGSQHHEMARGLLHAEPAFAGAMAEALDVLLATTGTCLHGVFGESGPPLGAELDRPAIALPAIAVVQVAAVELLASWGIRPSAVLGHSMGEHTAAWCAGMLSLSELFGIVTARGRILEQAGAGVMLSIAVAPAALERLLAGLDVSLAAVNSPSSCVVSGGPRQVEELEDRLKAEGVESLRLRLSSAAHSPALDPFLPAWREAVQKIVLTRPAVPFVSGLTGLVEHLRLVDADYWVEQFRRPVDFSAAVATARRHGSVLVDVGPGRSLASLARQQTPAFSAMVPVFRHASAPLDDDEVAAARVAAAVWQAGGPVKLDELGPPDGGRTRLPPPVLERQPFWIDPPTRTPPSPRVVDRTREPSEWLTAESWVQADLPVPTTMPAGRDLVFVEGDLGDAVARQLSELGRDVWTVAPGARLGMTGEHAFVVDPTEPQHLTAVFEHLTRRAIPPDRIIHLWAASSLSTAPAGERLREARRWQDSVLWTGRAAHDLLTGEVELVVTVAGTIEAEPGDLLDAARGLVSGASSVLPSEFEGLKVRCIDVPLRAGRTRAGSSRSTAVAGRVVAELAAPGRPGRVALRQGARYLPVERPPSFLPDALPVRFRTAIVTGARGAVGQHLVRHLASRRVSMLLVASPRSGETEQGVLTAEVEALGGKASWVSADLSDAHEVRRVVAQAKAELGSVDALFHLAGLLDDRLVVQRDALTSARVVEAKALASLLLEEALTKEDLQHVVLFSSISARAAVPGQADYAGANAVLDTQAAAWRSRNPRAHVVSLQWGRWAVEGMGAPARARSKRLFSLEADHWLFAEHQVRGAGPLLPGTALVNMILESLLTEGRAVTDLAIVAPVHPGENVEIAQSDDGVIVARAGEDRHVVAEAGTDGPLAHARLDLTQLVDRCPQLVAPTSPQPQHLQLGPRWNNVVHERRGTGEALARLDRPVGADDDAYLVHPAILDAAFGIGLQLAELNPDRLYAPVAVDACYVARRLPDQLWVHVVATPTPSGTSLDLTFTDLEGEFVATFQGASFTPVEPHRLARPARAHDALTRPADGHAITPEAGLAALELALQTRESLLTISPLPMTTWSALVPERSVRRHSQPLATRARLTAAEDATEAVASLMAEALGLSTMHPDDDFFALGGHSLLGLRLARAIRTSLGFPVDLATIVAAPTPRKLVRLAAPDAERSHAPARERRHVVPITRSGGKPPLFLIHGAGGNVANFHPLAARLADRPVFGVQALGVDQMTAPHDSLSDMADAYFDEVRSVRPHGPYLLGGHSVGGLLALEVAQRLVDCDEEVPLVVMLDSYCPELDRSLLQRAATVPFRLFYGGRQATERRLRRHWRRLVVPRPHAAHPDDIVSIDEQYFSWMERRYGQLQAEHECRPYAGRVLLLRANNPLARAAHPSDLGWRQVVSGAFDVVDVPGDHMTILQAPNVDTLANVLERAL